MPNPNPSPYPASPESQSIVYSVKEVLERIEAKLDGVTAQHEARLAMLERAPVPITNGEIRMANVEADIKALDTKVDALLVESNKRIGSQVTTTKIMGVLAFFATITGTVVAVVLNIIKAL